MKIHMTRSRPTRAGYYFIQYQRNFPPMLCAVIRSRGRLWLCTKTTRKPLAQVNAVYFSERL